MTGGAANFHSACALLEDLLKGEVRQRILEDLSKSKDFSKALTRLRDSMRSGRFRAGPSQIDLSGFIRTFNNRNAQDGFHILNDWDGRADKPNEDFIPVDVLHYVLRRNETAGSLNTVLAILLDYYFVYGLALLSLRAWDGGAADSALDRLTELLEYLQGPSGSGQKFAKDAETLVLIGTSHFEPDIMAYQRLLEKIRRLDRAHQLRVGFAHSAILSSHLRYGFENFYGKDLAKMRDDNAPDYGWLCFALATLMRTYETSDGFERQRCVEGLLNGLLPDARAFLGKTPAFMLAYEAERSQFLTAFQEHKEDLFKEFEQFRPSAQDYSPISFTFNFPHNVIKAAVVDGSIRGEPWKLTINDLLNGIPRGTEVGQSRLTFARTLMEYARSSPEIVRGRPVPAIRYDPNSGLRDFVKAIGIMKELV
jgi:hypothetical protein